MTGLLLGGGSPIAIAYQAGSVNFDGTNDCFTKASGGTITGSKVGIMSVWIRNDSGAWPSSGWVIHLSNSGGTARVTFGYGSNGRMIFTLLDSAGGDVFQRTFPNGTFTTGQWYHILFAWDANGPTITGYLNGVEFTAWGGTPTANNATVESCDRFAVGSNLAGNAKLEGLLFDLFFTMKETTDITVEANRWKFRNIAGKPIDLGASGTAQGFSQPDLYMSRAWSDNLGSGGSLTLAGALTAGATSPAS